MSVARAGSSVALVAIAWLLAGCGERPPAQAATQPGPATASSSTRIRALESTPQAREWLGQQRFERGSTEAPFYFFISLGTLFALRLLVYGTL